MVQDTLVTDEPLDTTLSDQFFRRGVKHVYLGIPFDYDLSDHYYGYNYECGRQAATVLRTLGINPKILLKPGRQTELTLKTASPYVW